MPLLRLVPALPRRLEDYAETVGDEVVDRAHQAAARLSGLRLLHLNATSYGGGVAELLASGIPLLRALGIDAEWRVIAGTPGFFEVTKRMHNALQGQEVDWGEGSEATYLAGLRENADNWANGYDVVVAHDPQVAAFLRVLDQSGRRANGAWVWRCHIDLTAPSQPVWHFLRPFVEDHDASVFTMEDFVPRDLRSPLVELIPPAIDPLAVKNIDLPPVTARAFLRAFGVDPRRPVLVQVSRFDPWKDPIGVIEAYRLVKEEHPEVQLVLAGSLASDDPEGERLLHLTREHARDDPDVFLLANPDGVGPAEVNGFQSGADVVIQKSLREGFGLTVTEAMWKRRPVVAGAVGGIRLQIEDGVSGFLVDSVEECAKRVVELLDHPHTRERMGASARERVRSRFTALHLVGRWLELMGRLVS